MKPRTHIAAALVVAIVAGLSVAAEQASIPQSQINEKKIFAGSSAGFEHPAEVDYQKIVESTPEYQDLKKSKLERGTGRYWILMTQASERGVMAIRATAEKDGYDLVCSSGYLGSLDPPVAADDITKDVVKAVPTVTDYTN